MLKSNRTNWQFPVNDIYNSNIKKVASTTNSVSLNVTVITLIIISVCCTQ